MGFPHEYILYSPSSAQEYDDSANYMTQNQDYEKWRLEVRISLTNKVKICVLAGTDILVQEQTQRVMNKRNKYNNLSILIKMMVEWNTNNASD